MKRSARVRRFASLALGALMLALCVSAQAEDEGGADVPEEAAAMTEEIVAPENIADSGGTEEAGAPPAQALSNTEQARHAEVEAQLLAEIGFPYAVEMSQCRGIELPTTECPSQRLLVYSTLNVADLPRLEALAMEYAMLERMRVGRLGGSPENCKLPPPELALEKNNCVARESASAAAEGDGAQSR